MTADATRDLIQRYYDAFNAGDTDAMLALVSDTIIHDVNQGGERRIGKERFQAFNARMTYHYEEALSDLVIFVNDDGTRAAAEFNVNGTYRMTEDGLPPARDQTYQLPAGTFFAVADGKITRVTTYYNLTDWITQVSEI
ncbi:MAG: ketosteroid isomerase-related protein [Pseudomonadota bacterium]